jgi:hypothetical protein
MAHCLHPRGDCSPRPRSLRAASFSSPGVIRQQAINGSLAELLPEASRETAERRQRDGRETAERRQRDGRETAERRQRDGRETAERDGRDGAELLPGAITPPTAPPSGRESSPTRGRGRRAQARLSISIAANGEWQAQRLPPLWPSPPPSPDAPSLRVAGSRRLGRLGPLRRRTGHPHDGRQAAPAGRHRCRAPRLCSASAPASRPHAPPPSATQGLRSRSSLAPRRALSAAAAWARWEAAWAAGARAAAAAHRGRRLTAA